MNLFAVGVGGCIGALMRYGTGQACKVIAPGSVFPVGTFAANVIGAFLIGIAYGYFSKNDMMGSSQQLFVMVGIMGGFTTFSSFSLETVNLMAGGKLGLAILYAAASVITCLVAVWLGIKIQF